MKAVIQCICGRRVKLATGRNCKRLCWCGAGISIGFTPFGQRVPLVTIPENSLEERIAAGHRVKSDAPVMVYFEE